MNLRPTVHPAPASMIYGDSSARDLRAKDWSPSCSSAWASWSVPLPAVVTAGWDIRAKDPKPFVGGDLIIQVTRSKHTP